MERHELCAKAATSYVPTRFIAVGNGSPGGGKNSIRLVVPVEDGMHVS